jgi:hypothetical protein
MPIIDDNSPVLNQTSCEYWQDELKNARIILYEVNKAIQALTEKGHQSYTLDTGQSVQKVTRLDLDSLYNQRQILYGQIADLELHPCNKTNNSVIQGRPGW